MKVIARATLKDGSDPTRRQLIQHLRRVRGAVPARGRGGFRGAAAARVRAVAAEPVAPARTTSSRFRHVLIDEFQDTNAIQYAWSLLVAGQDGAPFVVGDDDQSIYRWRGARVENLTRFRATIRPRSCSASSRTTAPRATS